MSNAVSRTFSTLDGRKSLNKAAERFPGYRKNEIAAHRLPLDLTHPRTPPLSCIVAFAESRHNPVRDQDLGTLTEESEETPEEGKEQERGAPSISSTDPDEPEAAVSSAGRNGGVRLYSFGRGDLGALLHGDDADHSAGEGPVALKDHWSVIQVGRRVRARAWGGDREPDSPGKL